MTQTDGLGLSDEFLPAGELARDDALALIRRRHHLLRKGAWRVSDNGDSWHVEYGRRRSSRSARYTREYFCIACDWFVLKATGEVIR